MTTATIAVLSVSLLLAPAPQLKEGEAAAMALDSGTGFLHVCAPALTASAENGFAASTAMLCSAYVSGVIGGWSAGSVVAGKEILPPIPLPENTTRGQTLRTVLKYLDDHPGELHLPLHTLVVAALLEAFGDEPNEDDDGP